MKHPSQNACIFIHTGDVNPKRENSFSPIPGYKPHRFRIHILKSIVIAIVKTLSMDYVQLFNHEFMP